MGTPKFPGLVGRAIEALGCDTQRDLAKKLAVTDATVSEWKHAGFISADTLLRISELGGVTMNWLLTGGQPKYLVLDDPLTLTLRFVGPSLGKYLLHLKDEAAGEGRTTEDMAIHLLAEAIDARARDRYKAGLQEERVDAVVDFLSQSIIDLSIRRRRAPKKQRKGRSKGA